jgi:Host cell surface-exposed lipoprotein
MMKIRTIGGAVAVAAGLILTATGCGPTVSAGSTDSTSASDITNDLKPTTSAPASESCAYCAQESQQAGALSSAEQQAQAALSSDQAALSSDEAAPAGPAIPAGEANALAKARQYLQFSAFSRAGLIKQLTSSYGEGFSLADATYAVDHVGADWNEQAAKKAQEYLRIEPFSHAGLVKQLSSPYGDQFTVAQAEYGVKAAGL